MVKWTPADLNILERIIDLLQQSRNPESHASRVAMLTMALEKLTALICQLLWRYQ